MNKQIERKSGQDRIAENVIYKRELNHSYMVLPCQDKDMAERYEEALTKIGIHRRSGMITGLCSTTELEGCFRAVCGIWMEKSFYTMTLLPASRLHGCMKAGG